MRIDQNETVQFGDLPQSNKRGPDTKLSALVAQLQARPGEWAIVEIHDRQTSAGSAGRKYVRRGCEVATRDDGGKGVLWARWPEGAEVTP